MARFSRNARSRDLTIRVGVAPGPATRSAPDLWALVDALEDLGYDSIWLSETLTGPGLAAIPTMAAIAARTSRLKIGTSVLALPPRNPVLLARELATIDVLSDGRVLPAGGLGLNSPAERGALGDATHDRVARLVEVMHVVRLLWSGDAVSFKGVYCTLDDVRLDPAPVRSTLEFWLGGRAPAALERIGRIADGWLASFVTPAEFADGTDVIRAAAAGAGRSIDEDHYGMTIFCAESAEELERSGYDRTLRALRDDLPSAEVVAIGPDALGTLLERFVDAGASKFVLVPVARDVPGLLAELRPVIRAAEGRS